MTISQDKTAQECMLEEVVSEEEKKKSALKKIGGFDLLSRRPLVGKNKCLYVISGRNVRSYSSENGNFLDEYSFGNQQAIVAIQQNPSNADELIVASENGMILTWNVMDNIKRSQSFLNLNETSSTVSFFQQVGSTYYFAITSQQKNGPKKTQLFYCPQNQLNNVMAMNQVDHINNDAFRSIAFGPTSNPEYCATLYENKVHVYQIPVKIDSKNHTHSITKEKKLTCIAFHPTDPLLATGDSLGQIIIWNSIMHKNSIKRILHWHSQRVNDIAFSPTGSFLYSVGNEKVLVKWNLVGQHAGEKSFLPRLGDAIKYVVVDPQMIVTSLDDQSLQIIDSQMNSVQAVIEGLTIGFNSSGKLASGLSFNSRLKSLTLNGRVGHVQLYCPSTQRQLFQLDISEQNVISAINVQPLKERLKNHENKLNPLFPIEVTHIAVSEDGSWMATVEYRDDHETLPEIRLKFWFLQQNNNFALNTTIHLPHQEQITFIAFSPIGLDGNLHLVSTSKDKSFKVWDLNADDVKKWWNCSRNASLNSFSVPRHAAFSADLSLLAVLFDNVVTLWELDSPTTIRYIPRMDIFNLEKNKEILFLSFGSGDLSHYLIEGRPRSVTVRNILNKFDVAFKHKLHSKSANSQWTSMTFNPYENVIAINSRIGIEFLSLQTRKVIMKIDFAHTANLTGELIACIFTPEFPKTVGLPLTRSTYYCMNEKHELFQAMPHKMQQVYDSENITLVGTEESQKTKLYMQHVQSQLSLMLNSKSKSKGPAEQTDPTAAESNYDANFVKKRKFLVDKYFYNVPSHVLPSVSILDKLFLASYLECLNISTENTATAEEKAIGDASEDELNSSSGQRIAFSEQTKDDDASSVTSNIAVVPTILDLQEDMPPESELFSGPRFGWLAKSFNDGGMDATES